MIRRTVRTGWRQLLLFAAMLTFASLVAHNLFYWQVLEHARMAQAAASIYDSEKDVPAPRGGIVDDATVPLVTGVPAYVVAADPKGIPQNWQRYDAAKLSRVLRRDPGPILSLLQTPNMRYVVIARQVDQSTADAIKALRLPGIILPLTYRAAYPQHNLAAGVLGFVDASGTGRYGLEQLYNTTLRGVDGSQLIYVDTANRPLPVGVQKPRPAVPGATLVLTIDSRIQSVVERRLAAAVQRYGAESGTAIVMDPHTGAILAMASLPSYDPNHFNQVPQSQYGAFQNLAIQSYQPGSTFKIVSVSAGLDSGAFTPNSMVYDPGFYTNYGITVHNWQVGVGWGWETPEIMLRHSANVGMAQFVNKMSPLTFYNYVINRFGFNSQTGVDLPDESPGYVRTPTNGRPWQMEDLLTNSYGQGINVTPLQLTTAVAALANGGWRMRPYIVQRVEYRDHAWVAKPRRVTQAVSAATATTMTDILQRSAVDGEATCALTKDYPVAAKTGTATIENPAAHGLNFNAGTVASLIGYAPVNDPKFVMLVTLTHPQPGPNNNDIWGSVVAAPAWHDIALALYRLMNIPPQPGSTPADLATMQGPTGWACGFMPQQ